MSKHLGLIIGVSQYQDSTFRPLQFAENDARALAQWLVNTQGGKWAPPDVQLVQGTYATRELVEALITQICINKAGRDDIVLLYFGGHAFVEQGSGEGYLALSNTSRQDPSSAISLTTITQQVLTRSYAKQIVCVLDCFQNGNAWNMQRSFPYDSKPLLGSAVISTLQQTPNRLYLCSCRGTERVPETGERGLGAFMHRAILGLCGPANDPNSGNITLPNLHAYLFSNLGEQQRPQLFGQQQPALILVGDIPVQADTTPPVVPKTGALGSMGKFVPNGSAFFQTQAATATATSTAPGVQQTPDPVANGNVLTSTINEHQQQCQRMLDYAQQFFQAKNYGEAFNLVEQVLQMVPGYPAALTLKAQLLGTAGRFQEALAVVDQLGQVNPANAMAWSMRAVLLSNTGQHQLALEAVEHSLELDAQNPETYAIKNNIMANVAQAQNNNGREPKSQFLNNPTEERQQGGARSALLSTGVQFLGLVIGSAGAVLPVFQRNLWMPITLVLVSVGLALLCVSAARSAFRYGIWRVAMTLLLCLVPAAALGGLYKFGYTRIIAQLKMPGHEWLLVPILFLAAWLAVAAIVPLLLAVVAFFSRLIARASKHAR